MNTATERLRMFENAAMHTDMLLTAKQAEMMAVLVERDQASTQSKHVVHTPGSCTQNAPQKHYICRPRFFPAVHNPV